MESGRFDQLEQTLEMFVENARHLCVIASDFQPNGQAVLNQKLQTLVSGLQELDHAKDMFKDVSIPMELLQTIDDGKNPHLYTRDCMERTLNKNKEMNGKIQMYKKFRALLLKELMEQFPKQTTYYRAMREVKKDSDE